MAQPELKPNLNVLLWIKGVMKCESYIWNLMKDKLGLNQRQMGELVWYWEICVLMLALTNQMMDPLKRARDVVRRLEMGKLLDK